MTRRVEYRRGESPHALADLPDGCADAIITDPPYGTGSADGGVVYGRRRDGGRATSIANDVDLSALESCAPSMARLLAPSGAMVLYCAPQRRRAVENIIEASGLNPIHSLPWDKAAPGISYRVRYAYEDAILAVHGDYDPWECRDTLIVPRRFSRVRHPEHPNQKPLALHVSDVAWACPNGGLVLDPFTGIATTGVAAIALGCSWIGVECDPQWWPIGERRLAEALNQPHSDIHQASLFGDPSEAV